MYEYVDSGFFGHRSRELAMATTSILRNVLFALYWAACSLPAFATGNCANGQTLYTTAVSGFPLTCSSSSCHKTDPSLGTNKILNGANNPTRIANAINGGVPEMSGFIGKFTASDLDDIATWIAAAPSCPAPSMAVVGASPASYAFPAAQTIGTTSAATTVTVSNTGTATATGVSVTNSNGTEFPATNTCAATLAAGASCTISVSFAPTASGARSATLTINNSAGAKTVSLSGTGQAAAKPGVLSVPGPFGFGATQAVGTASSPQAFTLTNTGGAAVTISSVASTNAAEFALSASTCAGSVAAGASCSFKVTFTPSAAGARSSSITITSTGTGSPQSIALSGTGTSVVPPGALSVPGAFAFGTQSVGVTSGPHAFALTNTGGTAVTISALASSNAAEFAISSSTCTGSVAAAATCSFSVTFTPSAAGARSTSIKITSSGVGSPQAIALSGTGSTGAVSGALSIPAAFAFADQVVGTTSAPHAFKLSNTGNAALTISGVAGSNTAEFALGASTCKGSLAAGASCTFNVTFAPTAAGTRSSSISVTSTGAGSPQIFAVSGNGTTSTPPCEDTIELTEYYHQGFDHYFVTGNSVEVSKLDAGAFVGWTKTGLKLKACAHEDHDTSNVCRFFSTAFAPKSSHFYTAKADECEALKGNSSWAFEGGVFDTVLAAADGTCAAGLVPVYRLYNNGKGGAPNHRYTTLVSLRDQMIADGWVLEGNGPGFAFMCAPQ
jgi:hypothetical protein